MISERERRRTNTHACVDIGVRNLDVNNAVLGVTERDRHVAVPKRMNQGQHGSGRRVSEEEAKDRRGPVRVAPPGFDDADGRFDVELHGRDLRAQRSGGSVAVRTRGGLGSVDVGALRHEAHLHRLHAV